MTVAIAEAKDQFTALARRVEGGDEIVVTRHGQPVMRWVPVTAKGKPPVSPHPLDWSKFKGIDLDAPVFEPLKGGA